MGIVSKLSHLWRGSLGSRIALAYAALMIACVGVLTIYLMAVSQDFYLGNLHHGAEAQARIVGEAVLPYFSPPHTPAEIDALAKRLGKQSGVRITVIDRNGVVLGDSEQDPTTMENHAGRPEVRDALSQGVGESSRRSVSVGYDTSYVAVPIFQDAQLMGVSRVAIPLASVNRTTAGIAVAMTVGGLLAIGLAVALALLIAQSIASPIKRLTSIAGQMAEGRLDRRVGDYTEDEVGQLGSAFDLMADRLRGTIKEISGERNTLSAILSTMADGILIVDWNGRVMLTNRAAGALLRTPSTELEGRTYVEALRDHELVTVLQRCLDQGTQQSGAAEIGPPRRSLRIVATPLRGEKTRALVLIQDLTEVRRAEVVRRDFIANVSHELRTPITTLKALVETLEDGAISEPELATDFLSKMHSEVDGIAQMVGELLELSRIESGQSPLHLAPLEVEPLVNNAVERLQPQAERVGLQISAELPPGSPNVQADGQRIQQVLANLIHNATKFTPSGGRITVGARMEEEQVAIWVADTGIGISSEDLPRIFERFYKADRSRTKGGGTGLGLAIAKHIVEAHGGHIRVESVEGKGATFTFTLPTVQP